MLPSQPVVEPLLRRGVPDDLGFIAWIDRGGEGSGLSFAEEWTEDQWTQRRREMLGFLVDEDKFTFVLEDVPGRRLLGAIFGRFINVKESLPSWSVFRMLPAALFPESGLLCEIFDLWVDPGVRRRGLATRLKREAEREAIRRGPIWDEVVRVSLLKTLAAEA